MSAKCQACELVLETAYPTLDLRPQARAAEYVCTDEIDGERVHHGFCRSHTKAWIRLSLARKRESSPVALLPGTQIQIPVGMH